jgi:hypothetical protein
MALCDFVTHINELVAILKPANLKYRLINEN